MEGMEVFSVHLRKELFVSAPIVLSFLMFGFPLALVSRVLSAIFMTNGRQCWGCSGMTRTEQTGLKLVWDRWNHVTGFFEVLGMSDLRPRDPQAIFRIAGGQKIAGTVAIEVNPSAEKEVRGVSWITQTGRNTEGVGLTFREVCRRLVPPVGVTDNIAVIAGFCGSVCQI